MTDGTEAEEGGATPADMPSDNPLDGMGVVFSMPKNIEIEMVDARALGDYELWFGITSLMLSCAVGFLIAYMQAIDPVENEPTAGTLGLITVMFVGFTLASGWLAVVKRKQLTKDRQKVTFKAGKTSS